MINKEMAGRLGNQMFQYSSMYAFMKDNGIEEKLNFSFEKVSKTQKNFYDSPNTLIDYNINNINVVKKININIFQKALIILVKAIEKLMRNIIKNPDVYEKKINKFEISIQPFLNKFSVYYMTYGYTKLKKGIFKNQIFCGNFESAKYFDNYKNDLKKMFKPKKPILDSNKDFYEKINNTTSVCVTIRRGDFLSSKNKDKFYSCDEKYFEDAINVIKTKVKNPKFFVFSDDIEWCKNNMKFPKGTLFETGKDPVWEKLRLMSACKHFIISNSTFSWWCQYLSNSDDKVVVAPKYWRNFGYYKDIYQDEWILVDNRR